MDRKQKEIEERDKAGEKAKRQSGESVKRKVEKENGLRDKTELKRK